MANLDYAELRRLLAEHDAGGGYVLTLANAVPALLDRIEELEAAEAQLKRIQSYCPHLSWSGIDRTPIDDPHKVWVCDHCGLRRTDAKAIAAAMRGKENTDA